MSFSRDNSVEAASYLRTFLDKTPLDLTAETLFRFSGKREAVAGLFNAYEDFLGVLSDKAKRKHLENLTPEQLESDSLYSDARKISQRFRDAVQSIFLSSDNPIGELAIRYGVF